MSVMQYCGDELRIYLKYYSSNLMIRKLLFSDAVHCNSACNRFNINNLAYVYLRSTTEAHRSLVIVPS